MIEVYCHTSPSGKRYVGWTARGHRARWDEHVGWARRGSDVPFHRAIRRHGADAFTHEVLEVVGTVSEAHSAERHWISQLGTYGAGGYNATLGGEGTTGMRMREDSKRKMSEYRRGRKRKPFTEKHLSRMREVRLGGKLSAEHRANIAAAGVGRAPSEETRDKLRRAATGNAHWLGRKHAPEDLAKMSAAWTPEMREAARRRLARRRFLAKVRSAWMREEAAL